MRRLFAITALVLLSASLTGCRCWPGFNRYADFIDDLNDEQVLWDQWYIPRLDISRAGRPDWCGPINRRLAPCRCNCTGQFDRADECWRYPSGYPYWYPDQALNVAPQPMPASDIPVLPEATPPAPEVYESPVIPPSDIPAPPAPQLGPPPLAPPPPPEE
ncbi:hypothetical protein GC163_14285 [bacterium]|nr:hypothetical protein [bacterium]